MIPEAPTLGDAQGRLPGLRGPAEHRPGRVDSGAAAPVFREERRSVRASAEAGGGRRRASGGAPLGPDPTPRAAWPRAAARGRGQDPGLPAVQGCAGILYYVMLYYTMLYYNMI